MNIIIIIIILIIIEALSHLFTTASWKQVVWGNTREVGCGWTLCSSIAGMNNGYYLVCNYGPP